MQKEQMKKKVKKEGKFRLIKGQNAIVWEYPVKKNEEVIRTSKTKKNLGGGE